MKSVICPYLRLTAETKIAVPDGTSLGFKPPALNSFLLISIEYIRLQDFELTVQAALGFVSHSANSLIISNVSERISQVNVVYHCGKDDQMALPSVDFLNPLPCFHLC